MTKGRIFKIASPILVLALMMSLLMVALPIATQVQAAPGELSYDNGIAYGGGGWTFQGVRFSLPTDVTLALVTTVKFYYSGLGDINLHITYDDHVTELTDPIPYSVAPAGWYEVDVDDAGVAVPKDFYVIIERLNTGNAMYDDDGNCGRSFRGDSLAALTSPAPGDLLIRVEISFAERHVGPGQDYETIQGAIDAADPGDTIIVHKLDEGTYSENVDVNKALIIQAAAEESVTVKAQYATDHVFEVTADNVTISGLDIFGATGSEKAGIYLQVLTDHCTISNNHCGYDSDAHNNSIGIYLVGSSNNTICNNKANGNEYYGICLVGSSNNTICNNKANGNEYYGIYLVGSSNNTICNNETNGNEKDGIYLGWSSNNTIYLNNFSDNSEANVYSEESTNTWNSPEEMTYEYEDGTYTSYLGNHWSDYEVKYPDAEEIDSTRVWNTPYSINEDNDDSPLMEPWENYLEIKPPTVTTNDASAITLESAILNGNLDDLGTAASVDVSFEWGVDTSYDNETRSEAMISPGTFSFDLSGLSPNTTYHFRAKAIDNDTSYGLDKSFTTVIQPPTVTTNDASAITFDSATLNENLDDLGTAASVDVSFEWGVDTSYDNETRSEAMISPGAFSFDLCGLAPNTTFHFRAKAVGRGTTYGSDKTFTTAPVPTITLGDMPDSISDNNPTFSGTITNAASAIDSVEYRVDEGRWQRAVFTPDDPKSGTFTFTISLSEGKHTIDVRAKDSVGNIVAEAASTQVTITPGGSNAWIIVVAVVGGVAIVALLVYFLVLRRRKKPATA